MASPWLKRYVRIFLETLPFLAIVFILNPILIAIAPRAPFDYIPSFFLLGGATLVIGALIALPIVFFSERYRQVFIALVRSLFIVLFAVTIFYPESGGQIDGGVKENQSALYYCTIYSIYLISILLFTFLFFKKIQSLANTYVILVFIGCGLAVYYPVEKWMKSDNQIAYFSDQTNLSYGSENNIIFIFADMLQGSTLEQYFAQHPEEKEKFQGFTFFSRAVSPFPFTYYSAPSILSGKLYCDNENKNQVNQVIRMQESSFITDVSDAGFNKTIIGIDTIQVDKDQLSYQSSDPYNTMLTLLLLSLQRVSKIALPFNALNAMDHLIGYKAKSVKIMEKLTKAPVGESKDKILFFHSMLPHAPIAYSKNDINAQFLILKPKEYTIENYWDELGFITTSFSDLFEHLKSLGIYDKSLIIITGDHGHHISYQMTMDKLRGAEDFMCRECGPWARNAGLYNPAILIKPPFKNESLEISRAASNTLGLRDLIKKFLMNKENKHVSGVSGVLQGERLQYIDDFKVSGMNKVVLFKPKIKSNPYTQANDHEVIEFKGNVSDLAKLFSQDRQKEQQSPLKLDTAITNPVPYCDHHWGLRENGAWLEDTTGSLSFQLCNIQNKNYSLQLIVIPFVNDKHPKQKVRFFVNDKDMGTFAFTKSGKQKVDLYIPMNILVNGRNQVKFEPLAAISPKEIGRSNHSKPLCFFLSSFLLAEIEQKDYKIGTTIDNLAPYGDHYWLIRAEGAWLQDHPATLDLYLPELEGKDHILKLNVVPVINKNHREQKIRLFVNESDLGEVSFKTPGKQQIEIVIPKNLLVAGMNKIKFEPLNAISPKEIGAWDHPSPLSIFLYSFRLE